MKTLVVSLCLVAGSLVQAHNAHASLGSYDSMELDSKQANFIDIRSSYQMQQLNRELLENLYKVEVSDAGSESVARVNDMLNFAGKCDSFATLKDMGQWGTLILNEMKRTHYTELYRGAPDLTNACPNFSSMNDEGREVVWVMVVNAMAHLESSCTLGIPAKGPNGALIGLLQLHNGAEQKYAKYCKKGDGKTAEGTFRCGLSMLEGQLSRDNALFSRKSYWDVLRPQAKTQKYLKIQKALKNLSICKAGSNVVIDSNVEIKNVPVPTPRPTDVVPTIETTPPVVSSPEANANEVSTKEATTIEEAISLGAQTAS